MQVITLKTKNIDFDCRKIQRFSVTFTALNPLPINRFQEVTGNFLPSQERLMNITGMSCAYSGLIVEPQASLMMPLCLCEITGSNHKSQANHKQACEQRSLEYQHFSGKSQNHTKNISKGKKKNRGKETSIHTMTYTGFTS